MNAALTPTSSREALLLIATGCAHCPNMITTLSQMVKEGQLARLTIINTSEAPEIATKYAVRSVPWTRIGRVQFTGVKGRDEIQQLLAQHHDGGDIAAYIRSQLAEGELSAVTHLLHQQPEHLSDLLGLLREAELPIQVKIGIGACIEDFAGSPVLSAHIQLLTSLSENDAPDVRGDATYYLSLTRNAEVLPVIRQRLADENADVREIAQEAVASLLAGMVD